MRGSTVGTTRTGPGRGGAGAQRAARGTGWGGRCRTGRDGVERQPEGVVRAPEETVVEAQALLDAGKPFHAHEVFEDAWKSGPEEERALWRGLAQLAVGLTHAARGNVTGGARLLRRGAGAVEEWGPGSGRRRPYGVDLAAVGAWARRLGRRRGAGGAAVDAGAWAPRLRGGGPGRPNGTVPDSGMAGRLRGRAAGDPVRSVSDCTDTSPVRNRPDTLYVQRDTLNVATGIRPARRHLILRERTVRRHRRGAYSKAAARPGRARREAPGRTGRRLGHAEK